MARNKKLTNMERIIAKMFYIIGIDVTPELYLKDQDNNNELYLNGKLIKYSLDETLPINRNIELLFNPFTSSYIMQYILSHYINKLKYEMEINIISIALNSNINGGFSLNLKDQENRNLDSSVYNNQALCYIDMIFRLSNEYINLKAFDI